MIMCQFIQLFCKSIAELRILQQQMSEFQLFTVNTKISQTESRLINLKGALEKIRQNVEKIEIQSVERVNKVALFNVQMAHTSEYTVKLGKQYFAKVKANNAINLLQQRIQHYKEEEKKWIQLRDKLKNKTTSLNTISKNNNHPEQHKTGSIEAIGVNQEGQDIFNIVQYSEGDTLYRPAVVSQVQKNQLKEIMESVQEEENQHMVGKAAEQKIAKTQIEKRVEQQKKQVKKEIQQIKVDEKPKKISKFKAERLQMKEDK